MAQKPEKKSDLNTFSTYLLTRSNILFKPSLWDYNAHIRPTIQHYN